MIERKVLKSKAKKVVKRKYWHVVAICFVIAFVTGTYSQNGTLNLIQAYDKDKEKSDVIEANLHETDTNNMGIIDDVLETVDQDIHGHESETTKNKFTRGVFSTLVNNITDSDSVVFGILNIVNQGVFKGKVMLSLELMAGTAIMIALWFFISNMLQVGQSRFFMEASYYDKIAARRVLLLVTVKRWVKGCSVMAVTAIYQWLWTLTVVGGAIKVHSYRMVPYIVAENPDITPKEAITLSRKMMDGYKWESFKLDMSFLGWNVLGLASLGVLGIFYVNPYQTATMTQFYFAVREAAIKNKIENYELLNDKYLVEKPIKGQEALQSYPTELFSLPEKMHKKWITTDYMRNYSLWSIILLFVIFSVIGWVWEVSLHLAQGGFVNRGVLHGPWLPIYGSGGVLVLVLLKKVRSKPWLTFILTVVVCGILEYSTSWYLETFKGHKWWDYSGYVLNLNGRICAEGLLIFGLGGCAFIYIFAPQIDDWIQKIPLKVQIALCVVLMGLFITDQVYSSKHPNTGKGVTDYSMNLDVPNDDFEKTLKHKGINYDAGCSECAMV